ncbi:MAG: hypothetical protein ACTSWX_06340 [Promethearchaeota archaeon]
MIPSQYIINQKNSKHCPECNSNLIQNGHECVCENCGLVIDSVLFVESFQFNDITSSELSAGDQYVSIGKTIDNICTLGSHIDFFSTKVFCDYKHQLIPSKLQKKFRKLKSYTLPIKIKNHETDYRILRILNNITKYLRLSSAVKNRAAYYYRSIKNKAPSIRNHISLIGFCIFYAAREYSNNAPISIREICEAFNIVGHRVSPRLILRDSIEYQNHIKKKNHPHKSEDFISRFINSIVTSPDVKNRLEKKKSKWDISTYKNLLEKKSQFIIDVINQGKKRSWNPFILAGAIVYCADKLLAREYNSKSILTQKLASQAMQIAEYSIRDHYVKILKPLFTAKYL